MTHERVKKKNKQRASEMNLAAMLLCIVFCFLVCHFPRILLNVHEFFMLDDMIDCGAGKWFFYESVLPDDQFSFKVGNTVLNRIFFECRFVQSSGKTSLCSANFIQNAFEWNFGDKYCFWLFEKIFFPYFEFMLQRALLFMKGLQMEEKSNFTASKNVPTLLHL